MIDPNRPVLRHFLLPLLVAGTLLLCSCKKESTKDAASDNATSTATTSKTGRTIGFSQSGEENEWRTAESQSIKSEAEKRGIKLNFNSADGDQNKQIKAMRTFIAQHVDAIILAPKTATGWDPVLREAKTAKIPVILVDRGVDAAPDLYATLIASNFTEEGNRAGEWLAKKLDGKGTIVQLEGTAGSDPANERKKGFEEAIAKHPDMKVVASQDGNFELPKGKEVMAGFLKSIGKDKINAVYAHNDAMALGAIQAIEEEGLKPGKDIVVVSIDSIKDGLQAIVDKKLNCSVECNPLLGAQAFDAADKVLAGQTLEKKIIQKDDLFDESNVTPELLQQRKY